MMIAEWNNLEILSTCEVRPKSDGGFSGALLSSLVARPSLIERIAAGQRNDPILVDYIQQLEAGSDLHSVKHYVVDSSGTLRSKGRIMDPEGDNLRRRLWMSVISLDTLYILEVPKCIKI